MKRLSKRDKILRTIGAVVALFVVVGLLELVKLNGDLEIMIADVSAIVYIANLWLPRKTSEKQEIREVNDVKE